MPPSDKNEQESSDKGILRREKIIGQQISYDGNQSAANKGCSKMDKEI